MADDDKENNKDDDDDSDGVSNAHAEVRTLIPADYCKKFE